MDDPKHYIVHERDTVFYRHKNGTVTGIVFKSDGPMIILNFKHCPICAGSTTELDESDMSLKDCRWCDNKVTQ